MPAATSSVSPPESFDASGRLLPLTSEEMALRVSLALQALETIEEIGDEAEHRETLAYLVRAVDEDRLSDRPRFGS